MSVRRAHFNPHRTAPVAVAWAAILLIGASAPAAHASTAGSLQVTVTPIDTKATYTQLVDDAAGVPPRPSVLGYEVSIRNAGRSTANHIRFTGTATTTVPQERATLTLNAVVGVGGCVVSGGGKAIDCPIGQLKSGESFRLFQVLFNTPVKTAIPNTPNGAVNFSGQLFVAGGAATGGRGGWKPGPDNPNSSPSNFTVAWSTAPIALGTVTNTEIRSVVLPAGGRLFTGVTGVPVVSEVVDNPLTTQIEVPHIGTARPAAIEIKPESVCPLENVTRCLLTEVTLPGSFSPFLAVRLRVDASAIRRTTDEESESSSPARIEDIVLTYTGGTFSSKEIPLCRFVAGSPVPNNQAGGMYPSGLPCIAFRKVYGEWISDSERTPPDLVGDYEWTIYNVVNGGYRVR
jgi:hypothetical protein